MGYRPKPKQYRLKFADGEHKGLEVVMKSMSVAEWELLMGPVPDDPRQRAQVNEAKLSLFASRVVAWNVEDDDGKPLPATLKGVRALDRPFMNDLLTAWQLALVGLDPTSDGESSSGATPPGMPEMPQEPLTADDLETASRGRSGPMT